MTLLSLSCLVSALDKCLCIFTLQWRHNGRDGVSNHWHLNCLLNRGFWGRWKKTSKLCVTGLCVGNSPITGDFPTQRASKAEDVPIWWHHPDLTYDIHIVALSETWDVVHPISFKENFRFFWHIKMYYLYIKHFKTVIKMAFLKTMTEKIMSSAMI